ncbi:hypothetical protein ACROYT_G022920, partial [Oculina patagonica]
ASQQMLKDVRQSFEQIIQKYPQIKGNLNKCYKEIEDITTHTQDTKEAKKIEKKEKIKTLLKKFNDNTSLDKSYEGLVHEGALNEDELIELINKLSKAITDCKKKMLSFASRQGLLLKEAKQTLEPQMFKHVRESCGFSTSHTNFLISLYNLFEEYPKLCYCAVPIRTFNSNMKIIRELCQEEHDFWSTV